MNVSICMDINMSKCNHEFRDSRNCVLCGWSPYVKTHEDIKIIEVLKNKPVFAEPSLEQQERYVAKCVERDRNRGNT